MTVNVNLEQLRKTLLGTARKHAPNDAVPYAFERGVMARLQTANRSNNWMLWGPALWRAAAACVIITTLCSVWSFWPAVGTETATLESTVFAAAEESVAIW